LEEEERRQQSKAKQSKASKQSKQLATLFGRILLRARVCAYLDCTTLSRRTTTTTTTTTMLLLEARSMLLVLLAAAVLALLGGGGGATITPATASAMSDAVESQMLLFQYYQNEMLAEPSAKLFTDTGCIVIPEGSGYAPICGHAAIADEWITYFDTLSYTRATILAPGLVINGDVGAYSKTLRTVRAADNCTAVVPIVNWFRFDLSAKPRPLIVSFHATFNVTDKTRQCP
jgi:hypothetical protein